MCLLEMYGGILGSIAHQCSIAWTLHTHHRHQISATSGGGYRQVQRRLPVKLVLLPGTLLGLALLIAACLPRPGPPLDLSSCLHHEHTLDGASQCSISTPSDTTTTDVFSNTIVTVATTLKLSPVAGSNRNNPHVNVRKATVSANSSRVFRSRYRNGRRIAWSSAKPNTFISAT